MPVNPALLEFHPRLTVWLSLASAAGVSLFILLHVMGLVHYSENHLILKGIMILLFLMTAWGAERWPERAQRLFVATLFLTTVIIGLIVLLEPDEHMALIFTGFTIFGTFLLGGWKVGLAQFALALSTLFLLGLRFPALFGNGFYIYLTLFMSLCALLGAAVHIQLVHLFNRIRAFERSLSDLAHTDELTGLLNLRGFMRQGEHLFKTHCHARQPLTLLLIDLDYFKQLNDSLGHGAGNAGLQHIATLMRLCLPQNALLGRFGGDEMIALLPHCDSHQAHRAVTLLYERLRTTAVTFEGQPLQLSLSIGGATLDRQQDHDLNDLLDRADEALYRAKASGRGQACFAEEAGSESKLPTASLASA